jgi:hypothetical protein
LSVIVLDGIETENPLGAKTVTTKFDDPQPTSLLKTSIAYLSSWPGIPHDPGDPHAHVLSIDARGALAVHPDVVPPSTDERHEKGHPRTSSGPAGSYQRVR